MLRRGMRKNSFCISIPKCQTHQNRYYQDVARPGRSPMRLMRKRRSKREREIGGVEDCMIDLNPFSEDLDKEDQ